MLRFMMLIEQYRFPESECPALPSPPGRAMRVSGDDQLRSWDREAPLRVAGVRGRRVQDPTYNVGFFVEKGVSLSNSTSSRGNPMEC